MCRGVGVCVWFGGGDVEEGMGGVYVTYLDTANTSNISCADAVFLELILELRYMAFLVSEVGLGLLGESWCSMPWIERLNSGCSHPVIV